MNKISLKTAFWTIMIYMAGVNAGIQFALIFKIEGQEGSWTKLSFSIILAAIFTAIAIRTKRTSHLQIMFFPEPKHD